MEDTLRGTRNDHQEERHRVLILILMEDTLRARSLHFNALD